MSLIGLSKGQFVSFNTIKALVFDTFGTVVDWRTSIIRQLSVLGPRKHVEVDWEAYAGAWRAGYHPAMDRTRRGEPTEMLTTVLNSLHSRTTASQATRWGQLIFGIICMVMIANLQYGWTLFVNPIDQKYHWGRAAIQVAFTIFVLTETWLVPIEGYLIDKFGPKIMICGSGVLVAIAWVINSVADSLFLLYVGAAIGGIGAGVIYGGSVGNALKWFPDRRGLAAGLTAAGFGAGSALTVIPIANMIQSSGYQSAFLWFGLGQGIVVVIVGLLLRAPQAGEVPAPMTPAVQQTRRDYSPMEVLSTQ